MGTTRQGFGSRMKLAEQPILFGCRNAAEQPPIAIALSAVNTLVILELLPLGKTMQPVKNLKNSRFCVLIRKQLSYLIEE